MEAKKPFFAKFLEGDVQQELKNSKGGAKTDKYPSDRDELVTDKYPSDDDEGVPVQVE